MIRAVLFDMDGTVFDSEKIYCACLAEVAKGSAMEKELAEVLLDISGRNRADIYAYLHARYGEEFPAEEIFAKRDERVMKQIDEEVIVPTPGFGLYESLIQIAGARMVPLDISKTGFQIDADVLKAAITPKTKAILLNSPNNPTGAVLNEQSLSAVKEAVLGKPIFVIWDNVYNQLSYSPCPDLSLDEDLREQLILCQSFSKPYAMTGWRVGYLTCADYVMDRFLLLSAATITAVPTFIQTAAIEALKTDPSPMREIYRQRRDYVCNRLRAMDLPFPNPEGAFYVFPSIAEFGIGSEEFCLRLIQEGKVAAVPGACFGADGYIRLSYCYSDAELKRGLDRLEDFVTKLRKKD